MSRQRSPVRGELISCSRQNLAKLRQFYRMTVRKIVDKSDRNKRCVFDFINLNDDFDHVHIAEMYLTVFEKELIEMH